MYPHSTITHFWFLLTTRNNNQKVSRIQNTWDKSTLPTVFQFLNYNPFPPDSPIHNYNRYIYVHKIISATLKNNATDLKYSYICKRILIYRDIIYLD